MKRLWITALIFLAIMAGVAWASGWRGAGAQDGFRLRDIIEFFGIVTFLSMTGAVATGYWMPKKRKALLIWHKRLAYTALCIATFHGALVLFFH